MPSREREGLPKAVIEAMSLGVVPIVSNVGGMPELVRNGVDGVVVPPEDSDSLAKAIIELANDSEKQKEFSQSSIERVKESFNIESTIAQTKAVYEELLKNPQ